MGSSQRRVGNGVCVVGAGVAGLTAVKNLKEQGFEVTAFERNSYVGGLWHATEDPERLSTLPSTQVVSHKYAMELSDFPMPEAFPNHPIAKDVGKYLEAYAEHFGLLPSIQLSTAVTSIERDESDTCWLVHVGPAETRRFDRVVVASGPYNVLRQPRLRGVQSFAGDVMHSQRFKSGAKYAGKRVVVMGSGPTGSNVACDLVDAGAAAVYLSHRHNLLFLPSDFEARRMTYRRTKLLGVAADWAPRLAEKAFGCLHYALGSAELPLIREGPLARPRDGSEGLSHNIGRASDALIPLLEQGKVKSVHGVAEITGPGSVALQDGRELEAIDAIICCTGYCSRTSLVKGPGSPLDPQYAQDGFRNIRAAPFYDEAAPYARLYRGILSERYPESLAFVGLYSQTRSIFPQVDLHGMALAGLWSGSHPLPSPAEAKAQIDRHYERAVRLLQTGPMLLPLYTSLDVSTSDWMETVAGTGLRENLGFWTWKAWRLWWTDRDMYRMLMDGPNLPAAMRYFDTPRGRKAWPGARGHIERVNRAMAKERLGDAVDVGASRGKGGVKSS